MKKLISFLINNESKLKISSKDIKKGDVFIALPGGKTHGNFYIQDAFDRGAFYAVTDKTLKNSIMNENILKVKNIFDFLLKIAKQKRELFKGIVIGITGSVGKTSVKENLYYLLKNNFKVSASIKSYNNYLGVLISLININLKSHFAIFEIGTNNFNEIKKLTTLIKPSQAIITNIFPTHLEKLLSTKNIAIEKSDIFKKKYNPNIDLVILPINNTDEKFLIDKAKEEKINTILSFGKGKNSNLKINSVKKNKIKSYKINILFEDINFNFLINKNHFYKINNFLICFLIFHYNKINLDYFYNFTEDMPLITGRGLEREIILNQQKITLIDESYNASPQTMKVCIQIFDEIKLKKNQKKYLILGDMKELGKNQLEYHIKLLKLIHRKKILNVIVCGKLMKLALKEINETKIMCFMTMELIFSFLKKNISNNDIILIKGSNSSLSNKLCKKIIKLENK